MKATPKCLPRKVGGRATKRTGSTRPDDDTSAPQDVPLWAEDTPPDHRYILTMMENGDAGIDDIDMTRDEFIALKQHLAAMRGYVIIDAATALASIARKEDESRSYESFTNSSQQLAHQILIARSIFRLCPVAVVTTDKALTASLWDLADEIVPDYRV